MEWEFMWMRQALRRRNVFYQGWGFMSTPYRARVHAMMRSVEGRREQIAVGKL